MSRARRLVPTLIAALVAGAITAGCDNTVEPTTVTKPQAIERTTARAQEALQQLPPGATLKIRRNEPDMPCDSGPDGRTFVEMDYTIQYPDGWPVEKIIPILADYWAKRGYKIVKDERDRDKLPTIGVEHPDGFRIGASLTYRDNGRIDAYLVSSSPCL